MVVGSSHILWEASGHEPPASLTASDEVQEWRREERL
jgi:hypothetical protein